jgi:hypothetical protein
MSNSFYFCIDVKEVEQDWYLPVGKLIEKASGTSLSSQDHFAVLERTVVDQAFIPELAELKKKFGSDVPMYEISRREMDSFKVAEQKGEGLGKSLFNGLVGRMSIPDEIHSLARIADIYKGIIQIHRIGKAGKPCPYLLSDNYFLDYCKEIKRIRGTSKMDPRIKKNQKRMLAPTEFLSVKSDYEELYNFDVRFNFPVELDPNVWIKFWDKLDQTDKLWDDLTIREQWPGLEGKKIFTMVFKMYREEQMEKMRIKDKAAMIETEIFKRTPTRLSIDNPALVGQLKEHLRDLGEIARFAAEKNLAFVKYYI